jgi:hypothetical protein
MLSKDEVTKAITQMKQHIGLRTLTFTVGMLSILGIAWKVPQWQTAAIPDVEKRITAENAARTVLIQGFGGLFFILTAYISLENLKATQKNVEATQRNVKATEEKQVAERFSTAIELLAHKSIHVRLGGIYALEKIAATEDSYYWQVMETLTAYVRERSPVPYFNDLHDAGDQPSPIATDIQAVMTVLSRRRYSYQNGEDYRLDLSHTNLFLLQLPPQANLAGIDFSHTNLQEAIFKEANLQEAILKEANLQEAILERAEMQAISLEGANMQGAQLAKAKLPKAQLWCTRLQKACLDDADLRGANLLAAKLQKAHLIDANLQGANLLEAEMQEADLRGAKLYGARLRSLGSWRDTIGLTWEKLKYAEYVKEELPDYLLQNSPTASTIELPNSTANPESFADEIKPPQP